MARTRSKPKTNHTVNATIVDRQSYYQIRIRKMVDGVSASVPGLPRYNYDTTSQASKKEAHRQANLFVLHYKDDLLASRLGEARLAEKAAKEEADRVPTLEDWLDKFEDEALDNPIQGLERGGAKQERNLLSRIRRIYAPDMLAIPVNALTVAHFTTIKSRIKGRAAYNKTQRKTGSPGPNANSIRRIFYFFAAVWNHCDGKTGDMPRPWVKVMPPPVNDERNRTLSAKEWTDIKAHLSTADPQAHDAIVFTLSMACRRSETIRLLWSHIKLGKTAATSTLTFYETKSPKLGHRPNRTVPVYPEAFAVLKTLAKKFKNRSSDTQVFQLPADRMTKSFRDAVLAANIKATKNNPLPRLHDTRHTTATLLAKNFDGLLLQKITGHKDPRSLRRYIHPAPADLYSDTTLK